METTPLLATSIPTFCRSHTLSVSQYYEMRKEGLTPREMRIGRKVIISVEAAEEWRRRMEALTQESAAA